MKTLPVALQLYTVRDLMEKDLPGTLRAVKEAGYDYVETAGFGALPAAEMRRELDAAGLTCVSAHIPLEEFAVDPDAAIAACAPLGCRYFVMPYMVEDKRPGSPGFPDTVADIWRIGQACARAGKVLLYHNHDFEFVQIDGKYALDILYDSVPAEYLQSQLDVCWVRVGGEDPVKYLEKYADRAPVVHLKDYVGEKSAHMYELIGIESEKKAATAFEFRPVGAGVQDFSAILAAVAKTNAEYVVVEQDLSYAQSSIDAARQSRAYLKSLGW